MLLCYTKMMLGIKPCWLQGVLLPTYIERFIESCIFFDVLQLLCSGQCRSFKMSLFKVKLEIVTPGSKLGVFRVVKMRSGLSPLRLAMLETLGTWQKARLKLCC